VSARLGWSRRAVLVVVAAGVAVLAPAAGAQAAGLVAAYGFEENSGTTTADVSGKSHNGTLVGGTAWTTAGHAGNGLTFDGVNDMVTVANAADLSLTGAGTIEAYVRPTATGAYRTAVIKELPGDLAYALYSNDDTNRASAWLRIGSSYPNAHSTQQVPLNAWTHLAMTYDAITLKLFVNGTQVASVPASGAAVSSTGPLRFGGNSVWGEWFRGTLDDIRLYDRALSAAEIQTDLNTPVGGTVGPPPPPPPPPPPAADQVGQWAAPVSVPLVAVHMTLLPNGRVAMWDGFSNAPNSERVWDPGTGLFTSIPSGRNLFCAVNIKLADGRMAVIGGHNAVYAGVNNVSLFDYKTNAWAAAAPMSRARWYPSSVTMPDGRVFTVSGDNYFDQPAQPQGPLRHPSSTLPEIYDPKLNTWTSIPSGARTIPYFPQIFVTPDGRIVDVGPDTTTRVFSLQTGEWSVLGTSPFDGHSAAMYRPGKILKTGTWADTDYPDLTVTNKSAVLDMNDPSPAWRDVTPMKNPRAYHNLVLLPDGKVMALGGDRTSRGIVPASGVLDPEIWDPDTDTWTTMAPHQRARLYHQTSLLLPDGRVLLAGSGALDGGAPDERSFEIYSPPYMFKGTRPTITSMPTTVRHALPFTIDTPDADKIQHVSLVRMGSQTHSVDLDQRFQWLDFTKGSGSLLVDGPQNANIAPPGWYMVFLVDDKGVPSVGKIVQIPIPPSDTTPPSAPGSLTAQGSLGRAQLDWAAATDNVGVTQYSVHRSATAGFTPSAANRVGTTPGLSYSDTGLAAGTYYYRVVASDADGNSGPPSDEAFAVVTADTTGPTVSVSAPAAGATVSGASVALSADASDDVGVASVQFRVDGTAVGAADTTNPFGVTWDSRTVANGSHDITAVAKDAAGNTTTSAAVTVTVSNQAPAGGLIAAYGFEEASGTTTADATGNAHLGTLVNGPTRSTAGKTGRALTFDGVNDSVAVADADDLDLTDGMTLEAWAFPTANGGWRTVMIKERPGNLVYALYANSDVNRPQVYGFTSSEVVAQGTAQIANNAWTHLAATYDGSTLRMYVNGVAVGSKAMTGSLIKSTGGLRIGGNTVWGEWFKGRLDDVRVYSRALSASEIQTDMGRAVT
jgi:Concanavalin A-like lectin/glucanases superfamily/Galactose oxidase-like, Early set domain/Bacterial Ig domain